MLYQVTGQERYAARSREILVAYANRYLSYPIHDNQGHPGGRGGHVASQSLTEATWLIEIAQAADLVWNALNESDQRAITDKMLRPALNQIIIPQKYGIHNIQNRENSAIGLVGFLLDDPKLIALAIDDPRYGFRAQMEKGVLPGGFWLEGSTGYHFFAMDGMWPLLEAARNCGRDLYGDKFKSLFDGPISLTMPDLSLPNFNDSGISPLQSHGEIYELAVARYHDAAYTTLLQLTGRTNRMALLFGTTDLPGGTFQTPAASRNLTGPGYAILQRGADTNATWLALKYGPHGGGHGHPDKNSFILYARGEVVAPDVGTHAYGSQLHSGWDKTTLAHNTLVVDEKSQDPAQGKCLAFGNEHGVDFSVTDAGPIYSDVHFIRSTAMIDSNLIVFVDQIQSGSVHIFDLAYHQVGKWQGLPSGTPWISSTSRSGYKYLENATTREANSGTVALQTATTNNWRVAITLAETSPTEVITGYGIWKTTEDKVPMLVQRRQAQQTAYVWAVSLDGVPVTLHVTDVSDTSGQRLDESQALVVQVTSGDRNWSLLANPERKNVNVRSAGSAQWQTDAVFTVR